MIDAPSHVASRSRGTLAQMRVTVRAFPEPQSLAEVIRDLQTTVRIQELRFEGSPIHMLWHILERIRTTPCFSWLVLGSRHNVR
jgi:hypothetical protein